MNDYNKREEETPVRKIVAEIRDKAKTASNNLPYRLDINFCKSEYKVTETEQELDEWVTQKRKETPGLDYMELRYYTAILIPISTNNPS